MSDFFGSWALRLTHSNQVGQPRLPSEIMSLSLYLQTHEPHGAKGIAAPEFTA